MKPLVLLSTLFIFCLSLTSKAQVTVTYSKVKEESTTKEVSSTATKKSGSTLKRTIKIVNPIDYPVTTSEITESKTNSVETAKSKTNSNKRKKKLSKRKLRALINEDIPF